MKYVIYSQYQNTKCVKYSEYDPHEASNISKMQHKKAGKIFTILNR